MALDADAAWAAVRDRVAVPLGVDVPEAAWGIHTTVDQDMANAARVHAVERGQDPSGLPLFTFGGAGPVHGAGVAAALAATRVVTPPGAGVMSAVGMLTAPTAFDFVRTAHALVADLTPETVDAIFAEMEDEGARLLGESGVPGGEVAHARFAEMRYAGQGAEIRVPVPPGGERGALAEAFAEAYRRLYARPGPDVPVEVLSWRLVSSGPPPRVALRLPEEAVGGEARKGVRKAYFPGPSGTSGGYVDTPVYDRYALAPGCAIEGPALVEERESTLVVPPGAVCAVAPDSSLIVDLRTEAPDA
jgi:N-methylhydantoinase A